MLDGTYQSVICLFMAYLVFYKANFVTFDGRDINDVKRLGAYFATPAVVVVNVYILLNTYRWDWLMVLITSISGLLIFFWTGVYTAFTAGFTFYKAAPQIYGQASFWAAIFLTIILALLPRFAFKSFQKIYRPRDVDIVREQIRQGKFDYLQETDVDTLPPPPPAKPFDSATSSETSRAGKLSGQPYSPDDDRRPMYPPSTAQTATTHNARSNNGSDGTNYTVDSFVRPYPEGQTSSEPPSAAPRDSYYSQALSNRQSLNSPTPRISLDRPRPSFDRARFSMDPVRASFEQSRDFTSAALLTRMESSVSSQGQGGGTGARSRDHTPDPMGQRGRHYIEPGQAI